MSAAPQDRRLAVLAAGDSYRQYVAEELVRWARQVLDVRPTFHLALTGGQTPRPIYALLGSTDFHDALPWDRVHFFWGDERNVPPDHPDSNYRLGWETWLAPRGIAGQQIHRMAGEASDLDRAARRYEQTLSHFLSPPKGEIPIMDLILLGMGEDGHTASLFPGTSALREERRWVVRNEVPQLATERLTFTFPLINQARAVWMLVTGAVKAPRMADVWQRSTATYPCQQVRPVAGELRWILDRPAASQLPASLLE